MQNAPKTNPVSGRFDLFVIPAKAGTQFIKNVALRPSYFLVSYIRGNNSLER